MDDSSGLPGSADAFLAQAPRVLLCLDFDGTLSPIVDDPAAAHVHPEAPAALIGLAGLVDHVAVVTGRPARQVLDLGDLETIGRALAAEGTELQVLGQYGNESWSLREGRVVAPPPPPGLAILMKELPGLLREHDAEAAYVEEKGLAVGVHTRRMGDPVATFERLLPPLRRRAEDLGLAVEPGRFVVEVRAPGMDKGVAVRRLVEQTGVGAVAFFGDDLGDLAAFHAVRELREDGVVGFLVCSASQEESALAELADLEVLGPDGVVAALRELATRLTGHTQPSAETD